MPPQTTPTLLEKRGLALAGMGVGFIIFCLILFLASVVFAIPASANAKTPLEVVKTGVDQAKNIIDNPSVKYEEKRKQLHDVLLPFFDTEEMAKRVLGVNRKKYENRLPEFTPLFIELIENQYLRLSTIDSAKDAEVVYGKETIDGDSYATVDTKILTKNGASTQVSYRLIFKNNEWKAFDIIVEGVSLIANYRSQFNAILNKGSSGNRDPFDFLLDKIKEKIAQTKSRE